MHILGSSDVVTDTKSGDFGGKRAVTASSISKSQDITKRRGGAPNVEVNPVAETTKDVDDMANDKTGKREFSRRAETWARDHSTREGYNHEADSDNRPAEDTDAVVAPDANTKIRSRIKPHIGEGEMKNRGV
jgi:hypothetical protein